MSETFGVISYYLETLEQRIADLNRRAEKLKLSTVETRVVAYRPGYRMNSEYVPAKHFVEVLGGRPVIPGFRFVGTVEHLEAGNILRMMPGEEEPSGFRHVSAKCDHCGKVRSRKDTYLVARESDGATLQVGRSCVKDFLGGVSPQQMAAALEFVKEIRESMSGMGGGGTYMIDVASVVEYAACAARRFGWMSKTAAAAREGSRSTASRVYPFLVPMDEETRKYYNENPNERLEPTDADTDVAAKAIAWALTQIGSPETYLNNLGLTCSKTEVEALGRDIGLLCSVVQAYLKAHGLDDAAKVKAAVNSSYVGEVGKRMEMELKYVGGRIVGDSGFGTTYLHNMTDTAGNQFVWFTSNDLKMNGGEEFLAKATVKGHKEFRGVKQTMLTRLKIVDLKEKAA
jgi:hypothetical protein